MKYVGYGKSDYRNLQFGIHIERERDGSATWLTVHFGIYGWHFVHYHRETRITGPEDNRAVLGWFHRGEERRAKGKGFAEGFAAAAAKGPVKHRFGCLNGQCPGCDDADC